jgi:transposase
MAKERKKYDKEFKLKVVEVSFMRRDVKGVAEEYGIDAQQLSVWRGPFKHHKEISFPGNGNKRPTQEQKNIAQLERDLREVTMERDILKNAISIFSNSDKKNLHS